MNNAAISACAGVLLVWNGGVTAAQTPTALRQQLESIVAITPSEGTPGSGLIIEIDPNRVIILTARHVVEGNAPVAGVDPAAQRFQYPCARTPVEVTFRFDPGRPVKSTSAYCSDVIDMAVIAVERPSSLPELPRFAEARSSADRENYQVFLAGFAGGADATPRPGEIVAKSEFELEIRALDIPPGFSGGAVFDRETGFLGIIVTAGALRATAIPIEALKQQLRLWKIPAGYIEAARVRDNTYFRKFSADDPAAEDARNAIRRYRSAFVARDAGLLMRAYANRDIRSRALSLFGDSNAIGLVLRDCDDTQNIARITCEFDLTVDRKTGPAVHMRSRGYKPADDEAVLCADPVHCGFDRMVFVLTKSDSRDDPFGYQIKEVCIEGECSPPAKVIE